MPDEQKGFTKRFMGKFFENALSDSGKASLSDLDIADVEPTFIKFLKKRTNGVEKTHEEAIEAYFAAVMKGEEAELDADIASYNFANSLRDLAIWGYKSSEYVSEEVLVYLPVPGEYIACGDLNELTGGKDWSL